MIPRVASLRWRVTLAFGLLGAVLSGLFAAATIFITEYYEVVLVDRMLESLAVDIGERQARKSGQSLNLPRVHAMQGFLRKPDGSGDVPEIYASLPPGMHEVDLDEGQEVRIGVFDSGGGRLYLAMNLTDVEPLEIYLERILAAIVIFGTLIASWLGWLFAGRTIAPVRRLAEAVDALPAHAQQTQLAVNAANDELGRLAVAIDSYQQRLMDAEAREQDFFADASHELRTPLAVVRGTAELLIDQEQPDTQSRARLDRLDRGVQTLADLLEVLLGLARGAMSAFESVEVASWLDQVLPKMRATGRLDLRLMPDAGQLVLRPREAGLVVRGILRRLNRSREAATIRIIVDRNGLTLESTRKSSAADDFPQALETGDRGLGVTLIGRLATQMGWIIDEGQFATGRISIRLPDPPALDQ
ncbi:MAG TPA: histidine kinase dimerization/phospho-acceptor domain-containing protein [Dokdonella sp.]|uniref:histidine kinase dimerization/phospho-acceptor domain-containing protein n=1 Tax=Dokdonella sp. TaxID=2291710 RepID=UPI002D8005C3|nr:histidine kinase dimerization/phospho-acceptor domain-containing protein [Dokdonella sp.]HET9032907.1 histidine kinase dimerization/phospho-acceptor domain-containing protein [Dokdonella sp.]